MTTDERSDPIRHAEHGDHGEFFVERGGERIAELTYSIDGDAAVASHTWVHPDHRGGTLAPDLVEAAVRWARQAQRKIVPTCPYILKVFGRTPAYGDVWKR